MAVRSTPIARKTGSIASNRRVLGLRWHFFTLGCSLAPADRSGSLASDCSICASHSVTFILGQLHVHLFQGLLHVLDVHAGEADEHQPLTEVGPQGDHHIGGPNDPMSRPWECSRCSHWASSTSDLGLAPQREACPGSMRQTSKP